MSTWSESCWGLELGWRAGGTPGQEEDPGTAQGLGTGTGPREGLPVPQGVWGHWGQIPPGQPWHRGPREAVAAHPRFPSCTDGDSRSSEEWSQVCFIFIFSCLP